MTTKTLRKPKPQRGRTVREVDFLTPLSVDECIEHLDTGRSPFKRWRLKVKIEDESFRVYLIHKWNDTSIFPGWAEGGLIERADGLTHVTGEIRREREILPVPIWIIRAGETGIFILNVALIVYYLLSDVNRMGVLFFAMLTISFSVLLVVDALRTEWIAHTWLLWLEDRLDVQRTK